MRKNLWEVLIIKDKDGTFYALVEDIMGVRKDLSVHLLESSTTKSLKKLLKTEDLEKLKTLKYQINNLPEPPSIEYTTINSHEFIKAISNKSFIKLKNHKAIMSKLS